MSEPSKSPSGGRRNEAIAGPFTVRDLTLFGGVVIAFVGSLLPLVRPDWPVNLWNAGSLFFLLVGIVGPVAAGALFAWRRFAPQARLRVGSLSVDQFASVTAVLCALFFFVFTVTALTPGGLVGLLGGLVLVAATTLARVIPVFAGDFDGRPEVPAHVVARDAVPATPRPQAVEDEASAAQGASKEGAGSFGAAAAAGAVGAGAVAAGAVGAGALGAAAWAGHGDDAAWGAASEPETEDVVGTPAAGGPAAAADASEPAGPVTSEEAGADSGPAEIGAADLLAPAGPQGEAPVESSIAAPAQHATAVPAPGGVDAPVDEPRPEGTAAEDHEAAPEDGEAAPEDGAEYGHTAAIGTIGEADGEAYGAPEPVVGSEPAAEPECASVGGPELESGAEPGLVAESAPGGPAASLPQGASDPATAVFPASTGAAEAQAPVAAAQYEDIGATRPFEEPGPSEAFWFAVSQPRSVVDPSTGRPVFTLEPGHWILALQDRGYEFVVQSPDGRIGILRELSGIERG